MTVDGKLLTALDFHMSMPIPFTYTTRHKQTRFDIIDLLTNPQVLQRPALSFDQLMSKNNCASFKVKINGDYATLLLSCFYAGA